MFIEGRVYMHNRCSDVAMKVLFIFEAETIVQWICLGYVGKPWVADTGLVKNERLYAEETNWNDITETYKEPRVVEGAL